MQSDEIGGNVTNRRKVSQEDDLSEKKGERLMRPGSPKHEGESVNREGPSQRMEAKPVSVTGSGRGSEQCKSNRESVSKA